MRRLLPALLCSLLLTAVPAAPATAAGCRDANARPGQVSATRHAKAVRCLLNTHRAGHGRRWLRHDARLGMSALVHTRDMVSRRFFGHRGSTGSSVRQRAAFFRYGRGSWSVAETLAYGRGRRGTPRAIVRLWLRSPGHRRVLLSGAWRDAGVAVVRRGRAVTVAAVFGRR